MLDKCGKMVYKNNNILPFQPIHRLFFAEISLSFINLMINFILITRKLKKNNNNKQVDSNENFKRY